MASIITITELLGDGIGPELAEAVEELLGALPLDIKLQKVDWSPWREW